jgi:hypothetical protein
LAAFSLSSYLSEEQAFRESRLAFHVERANRVTNMAVNEKAFERDMTIGTSLLVRDGKELKFIHRSFQEYFAAACICNLSDYKTPTIIEKISPRYQTDAVLSLILSMNDDKIERNWVLRLMPLLPA